MIDYRTPLIEIEPDPSKLRQAAVANAIWARDLRAADPEAEPILRELLGNPGRWKGHPVPWDLSRAYRAPRAGQPSQGVSTCGLVAAGLLLRIVALPWDGYWYWEGPGVYRGRDIVVCLGLLGCQTHARRAAGSRPLPGDPACIGSGLGTHVLTAIEDDGEIVTSIDGGQVDDAAHRYLQRTRRCERLWSGCRVNWVLDIEQLVRAYPRRSWLVPEGWDEVEVVPAPQVAPVAYQLGTTRGVQGALLELGYDVGPVDGVMGPRTRAAVMAYQRAVGLVADGVVGRMTRAALAAALSTSGTLQNCQAH